MKKINLLQAVAKWMGKKCLYDVYLILDFHQVYREDDAIVNCAFQLVGILMKEWMQSLAVDSSPCPGLPGLSLSKVERGEERRNRLTIEF